MPTPRRGRIPLLLICVVLCVGYFIAGLWPFATRVRNNLGWEPGQDGTTFGWLSSVFSEREFDLGGGSAAARTAGTISIELFLQSWHDQYRPLGSIVSLYDGDLPVNLLIAERGTELLVRALGRDSRGRRIARETRAEADFGRGTRHVAVITAGPEGTAFYNDGKLVWAEPELVLRPEALRGRLVVGGAPEGKSRWVGKLIGLAIFDRSLSAAEVERHSRLWAGQGIQEISEEPGLAALYDFGARSGRTIPDLSASANPLLVPEYYRTLRKAVLAPPWREPYVGYFDSVDVIVNILGFIPLGFFFFLLLDRIRPRRTFHNIGLTVLVSAAVSLAIELIQVYMPSRFSSLSDLVSNVTGGLIGALLAVVVRGVAKALAGRPSKLG